MHEHENIHVVAEGALDHLRRLKGSLAEIGIEGEIVSPPKEKCSS